jgi:hypothetical protein
MPDAGCREPVLICFQIQMADGDDGRRVVAVGVGGGRTGNRNRE